MRERVTIMPERLIRPLQAHLARVKELHHQDLARGGGAVYLPSALSRKYPRAAREWVWQYVFPAEKISVDPRGGEKRRHHVAERNLQNRVRDAVRAAGIPKAASATRSGTVLQRTCWKMGMIFAPCRS